MKLNGEDTVFILRGAVCSIHGEELQPITFMKNWKSVMQSPSPLHQAKSEFVTYAHQCGSWDLVLLYSETCQNWTLSEIKTWFKRKIRNFRSFGSSFHDKKPV